MRSTTTTTTAARAPRHPHSSLLLSFVCLYLSIATTTTTTTTALDLGKLVKRNKPQQQQQQPSDNSALHDDASTGTVTHLTEEQEANIRTAMTCDNVLAKSVVQANEVRIVVEEERDAAVAAKAKALQEVELLRQELEKQTVEIKTLTDTLETFKEDAEMKMEEATVVLKQTIDTLEKERDYKVSLVTRDYHDLQQRREEEVAELKALAKEEVDNVTSSYEEKLGDVTSSYEEKIATLRLEHDEYVAAVKKEKEEHIEIVTKKAEEEKKRKEDEVLETKKQAEKALQDKHLEMEEVHVKKAEEIERLKKEAEEKHANLTGEAAKREKALLEEKHSTVSKMKKEHDDMLSQMHQKLEEKEQILADELEAKEKAARDALAKVQEMAKKEIETTKDHHQREVIRREESIRDLESNLSGLVSDYETLEKELDAHKEELDRWEALYASRSYCNLTHMSEDTTAAVVSASNYAAETLTVATKEATRIAEPHLKTANELYDKHLKEHVDKHYMPLHESHVKPALAETQNVVLKAADDGNKAFGAFHNKLVQVLSDSCPSLRESVPAPAATEWVCTHPHETVTRYLWCLLAIFVFLLRKRIWKLSLYIIHLPFWAIWASTPLRFIFPAKAKEVKEREEERKATKKNHQKPPSSGKTPAPPKPQVPTGAMPPVPRNGSMKETSMRRMMMDNNGKAKQGQ